MDFLLFDFFVFCPLVISVFGAIVALRTLSFRESFKKLAPKVNALIELANLYNNGLFSVPAVQSNNGIDPCSDVEDIQMLQFLDESGSNQFLIEK